MAEVQNAKPPVDRGWAWVILLATFLQVGLTSTTYLSGIYNVVFLEAFNQSIVLTSWCCSLHSSLLALAGPIASFLIKSIGARWTALTGTTLVFFGYLVPSQWPTFPVVFLFYGICAGFGIGLCYLPFMVWMGFHFKRHRNLAFGIVTTAGGFGAFAFSPLLHFLIQKYGWQGSMMLMAGIKAHLFIAASVLRPINFDTDNTEDENQIDRSVEHNTQTENLPLTSEDPQNELVHDVKTLEKMPQGCTDKQLLKPMNTSCFQELERRTAVVTLSQPNLYQSSSQTAQDKFHVSLDNVHSEPMKEATISPLIRHEKGLHRHLLPGESAQVQSHTQISSDAITRSMISLNSPWLKYDDKTKTECKTGSNTENTKVEGKWKTFLKEYRSLGNRKFLLFCANLFFVDIGLAIAYIYLPVLALSNGSTDFQVAQLLSLVGITNICSRLLTGLGTNSKDINTYVIYMGTCGIIGIVFFITPALSSCYIGQVGLAVCFGLYGNVFSAMMSPITIDIVGVSSLNVAHGAELLLCGTGMLLGPPIAGLLYEILGSFNAVMVLAGLCYFVGALIMMLIPVTSNEKVNT